MPIFEYECSDCGTICEYLLFQGEDPGQCKVCGSVRLRKLPSPSASYSGRHTISTPSPGDRGCCGERVGEASGCSGPGSCCGKG